VTGVCAIAKGVTVIGAVPRVFPVRGVNVPPGIMLKPAGAVRAGASIVYLLVCLVVAFGEKLLRGFAVNN
jgi:hypothetical protein